jgi:hypothetical protein
VQTVNRWDVNRDGHVDLLMINSHPLIEMLDMSIYWGNGKDFSIRDHTYVPADGPMWVAPADLNRDGEMDLVVANYSNGTWTDMDSYVYYGGLKRHGGTGETDDWAFYPFQRRLALPGSNAQKPAVGDFNRDGFPDIVFAFSGGFWEYRSSEGYSPSRIYWGGPDDFDRTRFSHIMTRGATDVAVADLNGDGWLELVFANGEGDSSFVYFGGEAGFSTDRMTRLPTAKPHAVEVGDVNNDGEADIVFAQEAGGFSVAYLGGNGRFRPERALRFPTHTAKDVVIRDFNRDGYSDLFFTNHQFSLTGNARRANRMIDSYLYYGSQEGFLDENRVSVQTIGAWGANAADLNGDGWEDLLVCNFREHYSYEVPSFVYWNGPEGFSLTRRTCLYEHGAQGSAIADLNGDGYPDILITSMMAGSRGDYDPNFLYLGDSEGAFTANRRIELPGREAYEQAFADLDDDGRVDILMVNRGEVTRHANELWIYWNRDNTFSPWRITGLPVYEGLGVEVADLDRDGYLDVIVSCGSGFQPPETGDPSPGSFIYWGGEKGWPVTDRTVLPIVATRACAVADMDEDGHLDLVFGQQKAWGEASIFYGNGTRRFDPERRFRISGSQGTSTPGVADLNGDGLLDIAFAHDRNVLVYYQTKKRTFTKEDRQVLEIQAKTMLVADVNRDEWLDLVCPFYKGGGKRTALSSVLLGGPDGYSLDRAVRLPTDGGTGSLVSDFNRDGFPDIFFYCHRADGSDEEIGKFGDHHTFSRLYRGGPGGFDPENRLEIPSVGAHYDTGADPGHIRNRKFVFTYESSPFYSDGRRPAAIAWKGETPGRTALSIQIRTAESREGLEKAAWMGPDGKGSAFTRSGTRINRIPAAEWVQYRALFDTDNGAASPVLEAVEIRLE